jgi:hypothetical protein
VDSLRLLLLPRRLGETFVLNFWMEKFEKKLRLLIRSENFLGKVEHKKIGKLKMGC